MTQTNWKNVNNWHWVEKNCFPWAKAYLEERLDQIKLDEGDTHMRVELLDMSGDVDLNQRKGKLVTLYDVKLTIQVIVTGDEQEEKGKIIIPEFAHDTEQDEIVFDISIKDKFKSILVSQIKPQLLQMFADFRGDLISAHAKDIMIENQSGGKSGYKPSPPAPTLADSKKEEHAAKGTTTISQRFSFMASANDIYECLLDEQRVRYWSRSNARVERRIDGEFNLFDGAVSGKFLELKEKEKIVMQWRHASWPKDHYSKVTMAIESNGNGVDLVLKQTGVPANDKERAEANWKEYYFRPIKLTFGYGSE